ncbi:ARM repeat superfamily protein [Tasmannia lanceolata]|uniref:ARM repeat superfamily protein n=1 Tax=Tasmannia lanceolata TaxID=3420 RepID=UPI0040633EAD
MAKEKENEAEKLLTKKISGILDECRNSYAVHLRKIKELSTVRSASRLRFFPCFSKALKPLFDFPRRTVSAERIVRFVSLFSVRRDEKNATDCDAFLDQFLQFLLIASDSSNKTARYRSCQIISEIIMRLPDDAEVSNELWDKVIDSMKQRTQDKVPAVRTFAIRALARFANDAENGDIIDLFLQALPHEQNSEVRKTLVLSMPPSNATSVAIIECTLDVNESVRRAAYCVLANKFPLQSLSIKLRTIILQRGLADRSPSVTKECLKLMKDEWLMKCCDGDPVVLLKYLDVETYESVGEAVMGALLKAGMVHVPDDQSIRQFLVSACTKNEGQHVPSIQLMEAEVALYWRTVCRHLQIEAQAKGSDAATTTGTEAAVYAAEATDNNDLLERVLPETVSDYVELVKAHLVAGPNYRFASRQLLLLGAMLDFSDATNRKVAGAFVQDLLHRSLEHEVDDDRNMVVIGDGINLGGEKDWAKAVSELAKKVHASVGEFDEVVIGVVEELARPCRERTADFIQWMHCLAVTGLFLENIKSLWCLQGKVIEASELLHSLLLPGAKHIHVEVQRVATRCLGLFGLVERKPSEELVKQLRLSFVNGPSSVSVMASKALLDLAMWHGPQEVDRAIGLDLSPQSSDDKEGFTSINLSAVNGDQNIGLLNLLNSGLDRDDWGEHTKSDDYESVESIIGEGFAKILLLSQNYPSIPTALHPLLLGRLINLYFSNQKDLHRLKQCLSVFFDHYPALSGEHKKCISKTFIPVMRSMWPGIFGNSGGAPVVVSAQRKRAAQASRFMLQMMQTPLYLKKTQEDQCSDKSPESHDDSSQSSLGIDSGEEGLAIQIAAEVASCPVKKTAAGKSYILALCRVAILLHFRSSEQAAIKCMRGLLSPMAEAASTDKEIVKELKRMSEHLKAIDEHPEQEFSQDQASLIFGKLELDFNLDMDISATLPPTPAPRSTRTATARRRVRREVSSSDDEEEASPVPVVPIVPITPSLVSGRSQRASKTAALSRMMNRRAAVEADEDEDSSESGLTSEETSDESDGVAE